MGASNKRSMGYFSVSKDGGNIVSFVIWLLRGWRVTVSASVITDHMELFAQSGPYIIPYGGIYDSIMKQNHSPWPGSALLLVETRSIHFDE